MTYDFDRIIDRTGSGDVKHSKLKEFFGRDDLLPLWVADMEFATPPFIIDALRRRLEHPILGYTVVPEELWSSIQRWLRDRHGWQVERDWLAFIPGIVKGIGMVVHAFVGQDERVIIQPPVYHPFRLVPQDNGREVVMNPLIEQHDDEGRLTGYAMDFEGLEALARDPRNRLLILANPHNPAGLTWDAETLRRVADICAANDVLVISDEIHCDMALFGHRHIPFASVSEAAAQCSITFSAPSKTFNIAGVVSSYAVVPNPQLRQRFFSWMNASELADPTLFAPIATIAAFSEEGEVWRRQLISYLEDNVRFVEDYCVRHLPMIHPLRPQASFLIWLDCRSLGLSHEALIDLFVNRARLALNEGGMFGSEGRGFMRLNIGSPRAMLQQAMERLRAAVEEVGSQG
ncbi:MAG: PatB family C-S lyase [Bacteroidaceae bacterium]|nr:PatB family C-S lyase [Bacteroidaceae bacterium]